jgi:hypothetical protein
MSALPHFSDLDLPHYGKRIIDLQGMQEPHDQPRVGSPDRVTQSVCATIDFSLSVASADPSFHN